LVETMLTKEHLRHNFLAFDLVFNWLPWFPCEFLQNTSSGSQLVVRRSPWRRAAWRVYQCLTVCHALFIVGRAGHALLWEPVKLQQMPLLLIASIGFTASIYASLQLFGRRLSLNVKLFNELSAGIPTEGMKNTRPGIHLLLLFLYKIKPLSHKPFSSAV
jgi:hypothetical protein